MAVEPDRWTLYLLKPAAGEVQEGKYHPAKNCPLEWRRKLSQLCEGRPPRASTKTLEVVCRRCQAHQTG